MRADRRKIRRRGRAGCVRRGGLAAAGSLPGVVPQPARRAVRDRPPLAAAGATTVIVSGWGSSTAAPSSTRWGFGAFAGAAAATALTYLLSTLVRSESAVGLLLTGVPSAPCSTPFCGC
jgi:hypothetical protein